MQCGEVTAGQIHDVDVVANAGTVGGRIIIAEYTQMRQATDGHLGESYAVATASQWSLDDLIFDVEQWLVDEISAKFAANEATAIVSGNGSARPTGFLNTTPTSG
jgi:HK97 family phage major capsid protein